jgi:hypothetical protein
MKSAPRKIPARLRANTDFSYVEKLTDSMKRTAVFYEYWRESPEHRHVVMKLREAGAFKGGWNGGGVDREFMRKLAREAKIFNSDVIMILARCDGFPEKPFRDSGIREHDKAWRVGMDSVVAWPWESLIALRDNFTRQGLTEMKFYENQPSGSTLHPISIPWSYTNEELVAMFQDLIPRLRPPDLPEPSKAGRGGRSLGAGVSVRLKQLAAFRLHRAGLDYDGANGKASYDSESAWKRAIRAAKNRIENMMKRPLFG